MSAAPQPRAANWKSTTFIGSPSKNRLSARISPCSSMSRSVSAGSAATARCAKSSAKSRDTSRNRAGAILEVDLPARRERGQQQIPRDRRVDARKLLQRRGIRGVGRPGMQPGQLFDAQPRPIHRKPREVVGVVPGLQVLEQQDEVDGVLGHARRICPRRRDRRVSGDVLVEGQLASVAAKQLHRSARFGHCGQLRDQSRRSAVTGQVQPVQQRREAAVHGDLLDTNIGDVAAAELQRSASAVSAGRCRREQRSCPHSPSSSSATYLTKCK